MAKTPKALHIIGEGVDTSYRAINALDSVQPKAFCGKLIYWTTNRAGIKYVAAKPELYKSGACTECWEIFDANN